MKEFSFRKALSCLVAFCSLFVFISCGEESGLGSSVDTEAPKLAVTYPQADAKIRDTFIFAGTCSDDKGIERIEVTIKSLSDENFVAPKSKYLASVKDSLTWTLSVNAKTDDGYELPDGKYELTAIAYDFSGRSSGAGSRQFVIDNTPPVFVITKPGVTKSVYDEKNSYSKYGSLFTVEGTIADDNSISKMDVKVYDKSGNVISSENENDFYTESDISTAGSTKVTIARYIKDLEEKTLQNKRYDAMNIKETALEGDADTKLLFCTVTVTDAAKVYTNPGDSGVASGNSTSAVYLYDDIYDTLMSATKGAGLSAAEFKNVLNGTATDDSLIINPDKALTVNEVKSVLDKNRKDTSEEGGRLAFTINPNADPSYSVSGFSFGFSDDGKKPASSVNKAAGEQTLTIIVSAGLDQVNIAPSSLKVWAKKLGTMDKPCSKAEAAEAVTALDSLEEEIDQLNTEIASLRESGTNAEIQEKQNQLKAKQAAQDKLGWTLVHDNSSDNSPSETRVSISTEVPGDNFVESEAYYLIVVTGKDKDDVRLSQNKKFGFIGTISFVAPSASITEPGDLSYVKDSKAESLVFKGTATENNIGMSLKSIKATLTATDETNSNKEVGKIEAVITGSTDHTWTEANGLSCTYDSSLKTNVWTFTPALCQDYSKIAAEKEGLMYMYELKVEVTGSGDLTANQKRQVHIDTTNPVVNITSVTPTVSGEEYFGGDDKNTYVNGSVSIKGNIEEQNLKEVTYDVWASTDLTKTLSAEDSILEELKAYTNGKVDGSLGKVYQITQSFDTKLITEFFNKKKGMDGDQKIQIEVLVKATDTVGNYSEYRSSSNNDGKNYIIYQETNRPKITLGNADESVKTKSGINVNTNLFGTTNNNRLQVSFSDDDMIVDYEIYVAKEGEDFSSTPSYTDTPGKTTASVNYTLPKEEGVYKVKIIARDYVENKFVDNTTGLKTVGEFFVAVDSGAPRLSVNTPQNNAFVSRTAGISYNGSSTGGVRGTISKRIGLKEFGGFVYQNGDASKKHLKELEDVVISNDKENDVYSWTATISTMPDSTHGESFKLEIYAIDDYGQDANVTLTLGIDETPPSIKLTEDTDTDFEENRKILESNSNYTVKDGVARYLVSGTWSDEYVDSTTNVTVKGTGTDKLYYAYAVEADENGKPVYGETKVATGTASSSAESSFNIYIPLTETTTFAYKVWGKDAAGNSSIEREEKGITVDLGKPVISVGTFPEYVNSSGSLNVSGTYSDSFGIQNFTVTAKKDGVEVSGSESRYTLSNTQEADGRSGSFKITVTPDSNHSTDGTWTFDIKVTDKAGRVTEKKGLKTIVDTTPPVWNDDLEVNGKAYTVSSGETTHAWYKSATMPFTGSLTENGSGIDIVKYSILKADEAGTAPSYSESFFTSKQDGGKETFKANLGEFDTKLSNSGSTPSRVYMKARDNAGNESEPKEFVIYIDTTSPEVDCEQNGKMISNGKVAIKVNGTVSDDASGLSKLILQLFNSSNIKCGDDITVTPGSDGKWTVSIPAGLADNSEYTVKSVAEDNAGNSVTQTLFKISIDSNAPTFAITGLSDYKVYTAEDVYTVKGTVSDGSNTSGIKGFYYTLTAQTAGLDGTYSIFNEDGSLKTGWGEGSVRSTTTKGEYTWSADVSLTDIESVDGSIPNTVYFAVVDEAENVSVVSSNPDSNKLNVYRDTTAPVTTLLGTGFKKPAKNVASGETGTKDEAGNLILAQDSALDETITYYATGSTYKISGVVTEASNTAKVTLDGTSVTPDSTGKWEIAGKTADGTYSHKIVITDKAGNSITKKVSVIRDTTKPTLTVSNDTDDRTALLTDKVITEKNDNHSEVDGVHYYLLSGKWSDNTAGTYKLQYRVSPKHDDGTYSNEWSEWRDVTDVTQSTAESSWSIKVPMTEGYGLGSGVGLQGRAIDAAGNIYTHDGHSGLMLDFSAPEFENVSTVPAYVKKGETLTITGTYKDNFSVDTVTCVAKKGGEVVSSGTSGYTFTTETTSEITVPGSGNYKLTKAGSFTITVVADDNNNGKWTFDLTVKDKANRETKLATLTTTVDTVKPVWNNYLLVNKASYSTTAQNWYKATALPFSGSLTEEGSGIKEVQYWITKAGESETEDPTDTFATTKNGSTESFTTNLGEFIAKLNGTAPVANTVKFVAIDKAGNKSEPKEFNIYIDTESPTFTCTQNGTQVTNGNKNITASGSFDDDAAGVKSVTLEISYTQGGTKTFVSIDSKTSIPASINETEKTWSYTIPATSLTVDATYSVKVTVEDNAGNKTSSTVFNIQKDTVPPVFKNPTVETTSSLNVYKPDNTKEEYFINNKVGTFSITGNVTDTNDVDYVEITVANKSDSNDKLDLSEDARKKNGSNYTFSDLDLSGKNWEAALVTLAATDMAGNSSTKEITLNFDNQAPQGIHAIDAYGKDLFFRIGENDNDEITNLTDDDKKVGGKYSVDTYGNEQTMRVRGNLVDSGSGIDTVYYKVIAAGSTTKTQDELKTEANTFLTNYSDDTKYTGFFKVNKDVTKRVFYTPLPGTKVYDKKGDEVDLSDSNSSIKDYVSNAGTETVEKVTATDGTKTQETKYHVTVKTNYENVFSGFEEGNNYLILVAVDKVGNAALDEVVVVTKGTNNSDVKTTYGNFLLNVDQTDPEFTVTTSDKSPYASLSGTTIFEGTATDAAAGIRSIAIKVNGKTLSTAKSSDNTAAPSGSTVKVATVVTKNDTTETTKVSTYYGTLEVEKTLATKNVKWKVGIYNDKVFTSTTANKNYSVDITVIDDAGKGNPKNDNVGTIFFDNTLPTVKLKTPTDADTETADIQINGTITLEGTISDNNALPETAITGIQYVNSDTAPASNATWADLPLYKAADTTAGTAKVKGLKLSGNSSFKAEEFDTTTLSDGTYYLRAVAVDKAGNVGYSSAQKVVVSQDSDRPEINFNNIEYSDTLKTYLLKHGTDAQVTGRITDDDSKSEGVVTKFIVSETEYKGGENENEPANLLGSSLSSSGDFTITPSDKEDGVKTFYIYIEDNGGKKFWTTYTSKAGNVTTNDCLQNPKISVKNVRKTDSDDKIFSYKSDSQNPSLGVGKGLPYALNTAAAVVAKDFSGNDFTLTGENASNSNLNANFIVGGTKRKYVKFYFTGHDASGIAGMSAVFKKGDTVITTLSTSSTWAGTENDDTAAWTTDFVDVTEKDNTGVYKWGTGQISVDFTITDRVGLVNSTSYSFMVDNEGPDITITKPESGSRETKEVTIEGTAYDSGSADTDTIKWAVPLKSNTTTNAETLKTTLTWYDYRITGKTVKNWGFAFDDIGVTETDRTNKTFTKGNPLLDVFDNESYAEPVDGVYTLRIYFMAEDKLGNYTIKTDYTIKHDPDGDRPQIKFSYPTKKDYATGESYATLGGTIRASGQAEIPYGTATVKNVYYQLTTENDTLFTKEYVEGLKDSSNKNYYTIVTAQNVLGSTVYTSITGETDSTKKKELLRKYGFSALKDLTDWWGIAASGSASWNFVVNENDELKSTVANETNHIKVRACGVNSDNKFGPWSDGDNVISIHVASGVPEFEYSIAQFSGTPTAESKPTAEQPYTADMYLKGQWYIIVTATDDAEVTSMSAAEGSAPIEPSVSVHEGSSEAGKKTYKLIIPVSTSSGSHTYTITAKDNTNNTSKMPFSLIVDNTAPTLTGIKGASAAFDATKKNTVQNSNGLFTLEGVSDDSESGVKHIVFYFIRSKGEIQTDTDRLILDPLVPNGTGTDKYAGSRVKLEGLTERKIKQGETEYSLWAKHVTGGSMPAKNQFAVTDALDSHVRKGGLIEINGVYRTITDISKDRKTVTFDKELAGTTQTEAYFPIAQVIDNTNSQDTSTSKNGEFKFAEGKDDGDGMPESFTKSGTQRLWDASLYSDNMPDGPATLVILAFDEAGNVNGITYNTMVSNNSPRIAKVHLGTDLNKNNSYSDNEFETYNIQADSDATQKTYDLKTAGFSKWAQDNAGEWQETVSNRKAFTVKNKLVVLPEFTGGNGEIKLIYVKDDTTTSSDGHKTGTAVAKTGELVSSEEQTSADYNRSIVGKYWELNDFKAQGTNKVSFTFWDSTEETTSGTDSLYAFLRVLDLNVDTTDKFAPNVVVNPFKWNSASDNSLYGGSGENGHIELEGDWKETATYKAQTGTAQTSGEYDGDPKVSGKIVIRGTAYDETLLKSLSFKMTDFGTSETAPIEVATYTAGVWTPKTTNDIAANFYEVTVTDDYLDQTGHKVNWEIAVDTSHLKDVTKVDAVFTVIANDDATTSHSSADTTATNLATGRGEAGTTDATKHKPSYVMDVVPYITGIKNLFTEEAPEAARSARGYYSVYDGETIEISGFNLKKENSVPTLSLNGESTTITTTDSDSSANLITAKVASSGTGTSKKTATTGEVTVTVNSVESLNNINLNPTFAAGATEASSDKAMYNSLANSTNNKRLTDDVKLCVWNKNFFIANTYVTDPAMKMTSNGNFYMVYDGNAGTTNNAYQLKMNANAFVGSNGNKSGTTGTIKNADGSYSNFHKNAVAVDENGNFYGASTNTDRVSNTSARFKYYLWTEAQNNEYDSDYYRNYNGRKTGYSLEQVYNASTKKYDRERVAIPKMFARKIDNDSRVYMSYFDGNHTDNPVKFRYSGGTDNGLLQDSNGTAQSGSTVTATTGSAANFHVVADKNKTYTGGRYTAVGATSGGVAVVAWYELSRNRLIFSYNTAPGTPVYGGVWQTNAQVIDAGGQYVDLYVDSKDGIHIAYQSGSKLKYAYLPTYNSKINKSNVVTVDSYGTTGTYITINTKDVTVTAADNTSKTYIVPYISYQNATYADTPRAVRIAWMPETIVKGDSANTADTTGKGTAVVKAGTVGNYFTEDWEVMAVPTVADTKSAIVYSGLPTSGTHWGGAGKYSPVLGYMTSSGFESAYIQY